MHPITRTTEPEYLSRYRARHPSSRWDEFKKNKPRLRLLRQAIEQMQNGLCAYCEIDLTESDHQIEHFYPKGESTEDYNANFDWENLLCCCKGGTIPHTEELEQQGRTTPKPIKENISCGQKKDNSIVDSGLSPTKWKFSLVKAVEIAGELSADGALKDGEFVSKNTVEIIPCDENCKEAGIETEKVRNFIEILNLNCVRLREARGEHWQKIVSESDDASDKKIHNLFQEYLLPNEAGTLRRFWTTSRSFFGAMGERWYAGLTEEI